METTNADNTTEETNDQGTEIKTMPDGTPYMEVKIPDVHKMQEEISKGIENKEIPLKTLRLFNSPKPQRLEYETKEEYKIRRLSIQNNDKQRSKGRVIWPSKLYGAATVQRAEEIVKIRKEFDEKREQAKNENDN